MARNTIKFTIMIFLIWVWLPMGTHDIVLTPLIVAEIGAPMYLIISVALVMWLYRAIEGRTLKAKLNNVMREINGLIK